MSNFIRKYQKILFTILIVVFISSILTILFYIGTYENKDKKHYMFYVKEQLSEDILRYEVIGKGEDDIFNEAYVELIVEILMATTHNTLVTKRYYVYIAWNNTWEENGFIERINYNFKSIKVHDRPFLREKLIDIEFKEIENEQLHSKDK